MSSEKYTENALHKIYLNRDVIKKFSDEFYAAKDLTEKFKQLIKDNNYSSVVLMIFAYHLHETVKESLVFKTVEGFHKKLTEEST